MTLLADPPVAVARRTPKRWTKREYTDALDRGFLEGERVYLYRGELIQMAGTGTLHARGINRVNTWLHRTFDPAYAIRCQVPFEVPGDTVPQPDAAVVTHDQEGRRPHPDAAVLVVGVCDSSVELDQEMSYDYAAAGVPDYWLVNVRDAQIEVYRRPTTDAASPTGHRYADRRVYAVGESLAPLARRDAVVAVAALTDVA